jgi:hypothetical protein
VEAPGKPVLNKKYGSKENSSVVIRANPCRSVAKGFAKTNAAKASHLRRIVRGSLNPAFPPLRSGEPMVLVRKRSLLRGVPHLPVLLQHRDSENHFSATLAVASGQPAPKSKS